MDLGAILASGTSWNLLGQAATLTVGFLLTPLVIRGLGPEAYGAYVFVLLLTSYMAFADLGQGLASTQLASESVVNGDDLGESQVTWTAVGLAAGSTLLAGVVVIIHAPTIVSHFLGDGANADRTVPTVLRIGVIAFVVRAVAAVLKAPQVARLRFGSYCLIHYGTAVIQTLLVVGILAAGGGLVGTMSGVLSATLVAGLLHLAVGVRLQPQLLHTGPERRLVTPLLRVGVPFAITACVGGALTQGDRFLVAGYHGASQLAFYSVATTLAQLVETGPATLTHPLLPLFSGLKARPDEARLRLAYAMSLRLVLLVTLPAVVGFAFLGDVVLRLWAGLPYATASYIPLVILSAASTAAALAHIPRTLLYGWGLSRTVANLQLIQVMPYAALAWWLTSQLGLAGAAFALLARNTVDTVLLFRVAGRIATPPVHVLFSGMAKLLVGAAVLTGGLRLVSRPAMPALPGVAVVLAALLFCLLFVWRAVLRPAERQFLLTLVLRLRHQIAVRGPR